MKIKVNMVLVRAIALVYLAATVAGCVYIPDFQQRPSAALGSSKSKAPLRAGHATKDQVIARFGTPKYETLQQRAIGYEFKPKIGFWIGIVMFHSPVPGIADDVARDFLWLEFDERGVLRRFKTHWLGSYFWTSEYDDKKEWMQFCSTVPDR